VSEARTWDGLADRDDRVVRLFDQSYPAIRERLRADLAGRGRILDVAAGTGQFTAGLAAARAEQLPGVFPVGYVVAKPAGAERTGH